MLAELCIRRPVMTILLMLSFVVAGIFGYRQLPVAAVPRVDFPTISVSASLPGASPETMASSVASVLERQFSNIAGITSMSSLSSQGNTSIVLQFELDRSIDSAALDVQAAISAAARRLPQDMPSPPSYRKVNPADQPILFVALSSETLKLSEVDKFAQSNILPRLSTVQGIAQVLIYGSQKYALRVQADLDQLKARGLSLLELQTALANANSTRPVGSVAEGARNRILESTGPLVTAKEFSDVIVGWQNGAPVRIKDVATVVDSVENDKVANWLNGTRSIVLAIQRQPDANTVDVVDRVKALLPSIEADMPASLKLQVLNDRSISIREAIHDVLFTLGLSIVLVILVIYLFLRSSRATLIPAIALPISLIGTFAGMHVLGHSLNNISLLALTLSVGFVVDDAIVMLENIIRRMENGEDALTASREGAKEISFTIISMTLSLVAVFIPVLFMGGVVGRMFSEFGLDISMAILISGVVSLTLTPMMCAYLLKPEQLHAQPSKIVALFDQVFQRVTKGYEQGLLWTLKHQKAMLWLTAATFVLTVFMYISMPKGFFPQEDNGFVTGFTVGPDDASFEAMATRQNALADLLRKDPAVASVMSVVGGGNAANTQNAGRFFITLKPKNERESATAVIARFRRLTAQIAGLNAFFQPVQSINIGATQSRSQYQMTLRATDLEGLRNFATDAEAILRRLPIIMDVNSDLQMRAQTTIVDIDRNTAARLGVSVDQIRNTISAAYSSRQVSTLFGADDTYQVILEAAPDDRNVQGLMSYLTVKSTSGQIIPLSVLGKLREEASVLTVAHLGQLPAVTISFNLSPGTSLSEAMESVKKALEQRGMPPGISLTFQGTAQQFQDALGNQALLLFAAVLVIYIVLGMLYESFIHPLTILSGLPSAGIGALITLSVTGNDLSVIALIGIVMLIGIVKKNAIMMIDVALEEKAKGHNPQTAILHAALVRFRPIMMTTLAAILGALPIALAIGAGAELRQPLGLAVVGGLFLSQILTLFITPVVYLALERVSDNFSRKLT